MHRHRYTDTIMNMPTLHNTTFQLPVREPAWWTEAGVPWTNPEDSRPT